MFVGLILIVKIRLNKLIFTQNDYLATLIVNREYFFVRGSAFLVHTIKKREYYETIIDTFEP